MIRRTITLPVPWISAGAKQMLTHFIAVFLLAFGTSLVAGATNVINVNTAWSAIIAAAAAGVTAVAHYVIGLIPTADVAAEQNRVGLTLVSKSSLYQVLVSVISTFLVILGAQLVGGAANVQSLPDAKAVVLSAIAAAVTGVVTYLFGLIPAPKPTPAIT